MVLVPSGYCLADLAELMLDGLSLSQVPSGGRSYDVTSDDDFAPEMDGCLMQLVVDWCDLCCIELATADCFLPCKCSASLVMEFLMPGYSAAPVQGLLPFLGFGCFEVAVGAALYVAEAGTDAHVFWNLAAVFCVGMRGAVRPCCCSWFQFAGGCQFMQKLGPVSC
ncbi:hypothetical protein Nepgr_011602 [Nepenthes gracilis]|uniref:Uncharacterized protein n=1 Tax=Nepenthes gracilis TaxID=150966 RepID=A0AAD3SFT6_NEPGR|nr:hypothetical protein Nepgr_011602 [Nepenthes gracilis]